MQEKRLGSEEFREVLLDLISPMILTRTYIATYDEFCNNLFFKLWQDYYFSVEDVSVRHYAKNLDIFFGNLFEYDSCSNKIEDNIEL